MESIKNKAAIDAGSGADIDHIPHSQREYQDRHAHFDPDYAQPMGIGL